MEIGEKTDLMLARMLSGQRKRSEGGCMERFNSTNLLRKKYLNAEAVAFWLAVDTTFHKTKIQRKTSKKLLLYILNFVDP